MAIMATHVAKLVVEEEKKRNPDLMHHARTLLIDRLKNGQRCAQPCNIQMCIL